jgi:pyruvate dehydrogenase E1 component alpha subunit
MNMLTYLNENGELDASFGQPIDDEVVLKAYKTMVLVRAVDKQMIILQRQGTISFAMSSLGEEACAVATAAALEPEDWIYPQYRENGTIFWRGLSIKQYVHHMFCDGKDIIHGRQMPNHFGSRALNVVHVSSPIGTKIPHAAGAAYAMKLLKEKRIAVCLFGEGATSEGDFHVGLNFAAVRKAPVIFFCRNNGYAISTPCQAQFASQGIAPKGIGYGIESLRVDGNDFFAVYAAVSKSRQKCLDGSGPILIEAMTYRLGAHSTSDDPSLYRKDGEVANWQAKDPLMRLRLYLEKKSLWDAEKESAYGLEVEVLIDEAIQEAKATAPPSKHSLIEDVYFDIPQTLTAEYRRWVENTSDPL